MFVQIDNVLTKMKGPQKQEATTRRRCDMTSKVVTGDVYLKAIKAAHERANKRKAPAKKTGQGEKIQHRTSPSLSSSSEEYEEEDEIPPTKTTATSSTVSQAQSLITDISEVIKSLDDDKLNSFYAVYYGPTYYWGKLRKCFSFDSDSDVDQVEMSFLRYRGNHCFDYPQTKDIETVDSKVCVRRAMYARHDSRARFSI